MFQTFLTELQMIPIPVLDPRRPIHQTHPIQENRLHRITHIMLHIFVHFYTFLFIFIAMQLTLLINFLQKVMF